MSRKIRLFLDFDGTVTTADVGDQFFLRFGGGSFASLNERYRAGEISAQGYYERSVAAVGTCSPADVARFLDEQRVDPGIHGLLGLCAGEEIPVTILSDGLDAYIRPLLEREGLGALQVFSNRMAWQPAEADGRVRGVLAFPNGNTECDRCASCKRNLMLGSAADGDVLIYVGDGYSDRCPVEYADVVFAKGSLQTWCQQSNITYLPYRTLDDVRERLATEVHSRTLRPRPRAERKRREAYMMEA
jgi:2-hydroxy-3-keto-5-methylthiopentenyl-1-phosphate phosphatase